MEPIRTTILVLCLVVFKFGVEGGELSYDFYEKSCPGVENIIKAGLEPILVTDITSPAALLRLMFHDCQVQVPPSSHTIILCVTGSVRFCFLNSVKSILTA